MRKGIYLILTIITVSFFVMAVYTDTIARAVYGYGQERRTEAFQYLDDDPHFGSITVSAQPVMYESVPTRVWFNFTINIIDDTPVDLTVEQVRFFFTPVNASPPFMDEDIPWLVGSHYPRLEVENASTVRYGGRAEVLPVILEGGTNVFLDVAVSFELRNHSSTQLHWYGQGVAINILSVEIVPAYLQSESWFLGMGATFLIWAIVLISSIRTRVANT
ncbi:MAG: hypothetical protein JSW61_09200 [Candidatus Thorarchaeota archaeon]|nr:MAG: hypothetical protein JSW61_09200 [Candidatus Thorarchaeota archaeon]